jgi:hypothetical protein
LAKTIMVTNFREFRILVVKNDFYMIPNAVLNLACILILHHLGLDSDCHWSV